MASAASVSSLRVQNAVLDISGKKHQKDKSTNNRINANILRKRAIVGALVLSISISLLLFQYTYYVLVSLSSALQAQKGFASFQVPSCSQLYHQPRPANFNDVVEQWPPARWSNYFPSINTLVVSVPKTGYTAYRSMAYAYKGGLCSKTKRSILLPKTCGMQLPLANQTLKRKQIIRVLTLRDPFDRALSTYYNSETNMHIHLSTSTEQFKEHGLATPMKLRCKNPGHCSFDESVQLLNYSWKFKGSSFLKNEHFYPQVQQNKYAHFHYDYVIPFTCDECKGCLPTLLRLNQVQANISTNPSKNSKLLMREKLAHFNPTIIRTLARWYAEDIALWCSITGKHKKLKSFTNCSQFQTKRRPKEIESVQK